MRTNKSKLRSQRGFTMPELMVSSFIALMITAMAAQSVNSMRNLYMHDIVRTRVDQDARGALDFVGVNVRQSGENLTMAFPAIEIQDGASGTPDILTLRRNLLDEVLAVCTSIAAGASDSDIVFANSSGLSGCDYSSNGTNYTAWSNYRQAQSGARTLAYIFNISTKQGEFFTYDGETNGGTSYSIHRSSGNWTYNYPAGASAVYIIEQYQFSMSGDLLQLVVNNDAANTLNIAYGLSDFQAFASMQDSTTKTQLLPTDNWTQIAYVDLTLSTIASFAQNNISTELHSHFFPRNILSN